MHEFNLHMEYLGQSEMTINLAGFFVGNGATRYLGEAPNSFMEDFANFNLVPFSMLKTYNDNSCMFNWKNVRPDSNSTACTDVFYKALNLTKGAGIDTYDLLHVKTIKKTTPLKSSRADRIDFFQSLMRNPSLSEGADTPLTIDEYLSDPEVKKALHVYEDVGNYSTVNDEIFKTYLVQREASQWIYEILYKNGYKLMHISGDVDMEVPLRGTWKWIKEMNWKVTKEWTPWISTEGDLIGYKQQWGNFTLTTVHGFGHGAILEAREHMSDLVTKFVHDISLF